MDTLPMPLPLMTGLFFGGALLLFLLADRHLRPMARRVRRFRRQRQAMGLGSAEDAPDQMHRLLARLHALLERLGLDGSEARRAIMAMLVQAGFRSSHSTALFQAALLIGPSLGALGGWLLAPLLLEAPGNGARLVVAMAGLAAGAMAPRLWLQNVTRKRQAALARALPDALDLYVICAEAGLSLDAAMSRVARELACATPALAEEFGLTAIELGFLPNRHEAFSNLLRRAPLPAIRGLVGMFQQTERYGTPLADALRTLAAEYRTEALLKAEEKAARLPAILTVPMIVFVLPPLFIVLVGPAIVQLLAVG